MGRNGILEEGLMLALTALLKASLLLIDAVRDGSSLAGAGSGFGLRARYIRCRCGCGFGRGFDTGTQQGLDRRSGQAQAGVESSKSRQHAWQEEQAEQAGVESALTTQEQG